MEEDANNNGGLRPISSPNMASRFPSLRRLNSSEPYRHRSLPADPSPGSDGGSDSTFAVLYDDGPDYHVGHYDESRSAAGGQRPDSQTSFAPSFRTRDSRIFSDEHEIGRHPDLLANQRLLAEGYMNHDAYTDQPMTPQFQPQFDTYSQETLSNNPYHNRYPSEKLALQMPEPERPISSHSHQSWCTCDDEHGHIHEPRRPDFDVEAQKEPATPTPFLQDEKKQNPNAIAPGPGGPGGKGPGGPGGPGGPPGGPPGLPPFPPGFPEELKVSCLTQSLTIQLITRRYNSMDQMIHLTRRIGQARRSGQQLPALRLFVFCRLWHLP